jgi:EAL domain-containing protein (putative c-di-GMP-specific phosphodiesterase class I)
LFSPAATLAGEYEASDSPLVLFQPIVDTFAHCVLAHECFVRTPKTGVPGTGSEDGRNPLQATQTRKLAIQSAASQNRGGLYLLRVTPAEVDDPEYDLGMAGEAASDAGLPPANVIVDMSEADLARDKEHSRRIREYVAASGFHFGLSGAGVAAGPDSFENIRDFNPEFIRVDKRLVRNIDRPAAAATVSQLARLADRSGGQLIAEGVDRIRMLENLWLLGVRFMQGDLFGRPAARVI